MSPLFRKVAFRLLFPIVAIPQIVIFMRNGSHRRDHVFTQKRWYQNTNQFLAFKSSRYFRGKTPLISECNVERKHASVDRDPRRNRTV